jgi:hypothetical protein
MHKYYEKSENLRIKIKQNEISGVPISPKLAIVPPLDLILIIRRYPYHKRKKNIYIYSSHNYIPGVPKKHLSMERTRGLR